MLPIKPVYSVTHHPGCYTVQIVELPGLEEHGDLTDWIGLDHSVEERIRIIREGASIDSSRITGGTHAETDLPREKELFSGNGSHTSGAIGCRGMFAGTSPHPPDSHTTTAAAEARKVDQPLQEQKLHVQVNHGRAHRSNVPDAMRRSQPGHRQTGKRTRPGRRTGRLQADVWRGLLADRGTTAFRDRRGTLYVEVPRAEVGESSGTRTYRLDDHDFALYLARFFFRETGRTASRQAITAVRWLLESEARYGAEVRPVFTRVAFLDGTVCQYRQKMGSPAL